MSARVVTTNRRSAHEHPHLDRVRVLIERLPEAVELETWGHPTFRAGKRIFAIFGGYEDAPSFNIKALPEEQAEALESPWCFSPPYTAHKGWIGVWADEVEWADLEPLLVRGYRQVALKRMLKALDG